MPESFNAVLRDAVVESAGRGGHEVRVIDLHAEGFDPVMGEQERLRYPVPDVNEVPVKAHLERLRWCTGLIFVYPTWWYGQPAMLKGWIDRVWVPHATFTLPTDRIDWTPHLTNIRLMGVVTTLGSPWPPASTLMVVTGFAREIFKVEVEAIAARPGTTQ